MAEKILIYGASGHAKVIIDIIEKGKEFEICGLLDDNFQKRGKFFGYPILGGFAELTKNIYNNCKLILAIGNNQSRKRLWGKIRPLGYELAYAIHPSSQIGRDVFVGKGTVVMANVVINSGSKIGENVILNTGATIDHDCIIGDYVHISPGVHLAGNVSIGELSHIGIGVSIVPNVRVGKNSVVGAGAVVIEDIPDNCTAIGVPAKVIKNHTE
ncbi:MAG: acetyltransferase [Deltaproteobacteria bacterium]|nr:MAG: acetyltransferase [Deltaproteobacteria bacterium]